MESRQIERSLASGSDARGACLVGGCPCKDPRIVSRRRAAFFATWARDHGETADRIVEPDPAWSVHIPETPVV